MTVAATDRADKVVAVALSSGLLRLGNLAQFIGLDDVVDVRQAHSSKVRPICVLAWGRKSSSRRACRYARAQGLPVWYLEDGWIRNCDQNAHSRKTYSLLIDKQGVYYDCHSRSDLENLLNLPDMQFQRVCQPADLDAARLCRERIVEHEITKYNFCSTMSDSSLKAAELKPLVLVIDQTANDASVSYGGMNAERFRLMLDSAIAENPKSRILVRTHPDVAAGRCSGYLTDYANSLGVEIHAKSDNPIQWLKQATRVYVGTSQIGYEALLCGCDVVVFGKPFYAGWGLTDDRSTLIRRHQQRSVDQLFFACHVWLARYADPVSGNQWTLEECIDHVIEQKKQFSRNAHRFCCVGITPWKRRYLSRYLRSPDGTLRFSRASNCKPDEQLLTWSYREQTHLRLANTAPIRFRVEDGFIRSRGLGSDFVAPASLVLDGPRMYFDSHGSSELEDLLNNHDCTEQQRLRGQRLRQKIVARNISKYNVGSASADHLKSEIVRDIGVKRILVVGQVEDDQSLMRGCSDIRSNSELISQVRKNNPNDYLIYKPHPDVESGNRDGQVNSELLRDCVNLVAVNEPIHECFDQSDEVHTMSSLAGFEALLRGKPVATYGMPFYAGWGLTQDRQDCSRRVRKRCVDELVYLALIAYPRYLHVPSGEFIQAEQLIDMFHEASDCDPARRTGQWLSKLNNISRALRYAA